MNLPSPLNATAINAQSSTTTLLVSERLVRNVNKWKRMKSVYTAGFRQLVSKRIFSNALLVSGNWFHLGVNSRKQYLKQHLNILMSPINISSKT